MNHFCQSHAGRIQRLFLFLSFFLYIFVILRDKKNFRHQLCRANIFLYGSVFRFSESFRNQTLRQFSREPQSVIDSPHFGANEESVIVQWGECIIIVNFGFNSRIKVCHRFLLRFRSIFHSCVAQSFLYNPILVSPNRSQLSPSTILFSRSPEKKKIIHSPHMGRMYNPIYVCGANVQHQLFWLDVVKSSFRIHLYVFWPHVRY